MTGPAANSAPGAQGRARIGGVACQGRPRDPPLTGQTRPTFGQAEARNARVARKAPILTPPATRQPRAHTPPQPRPAPRAARSRDRGPPRIPPVHRPRSGGRRTGRAGSGRRRPPQSGHRPHDGRHGPPDSRPPPDSRHPPGRHHRRRTPRPHRRSPLRPQDARRVAGGHGDMLAPARHPRSREDPARRRQRLRRRPGRLGRADRGRAPHDGDHGRPQHAPLRRRHRRDHLRERRRKRAPRAAARLLARRPRDRTRPRRAWILGRLRGRACPPRLPAAASDHGGRDRLRPGRLRDAPVPVGRDLRHVPQDRAHRRRPPHLHARRPHPAPRRPPGPVRGGRHPGAPCRRGQRSLLPRRLRAAVLRSCAEGRRRHHPGGLRPLRGPLAGARVGQLPGPIGSPDPRRPTTAARS